MTTATASTVTRHPRRRRPPDQVAQLIVRMSHQERDLVHAAARARGLTTRDYVTGLILAAAAKEAPTSP